MPRPNPLRAVQTEDNVARRVSYERERRAWTYDGTAKRLTDAGCPIQGSAIYKIEKGSPRRRISVDELVAFASVFDVDVTDLLMPVAAVASQEAQGLISEWARARADQADALARERAAWEGLRALVDRGHDADNAVADVLLDWAAHQWGPDRGDEAADYFMTDLRGEALEAHVARYPYARRPARKGDDGEHREAR